jgi:hypothetical protein
MKEFVTAAKDGIERRVEEKPISFLHDDTEVTFYEPSPGQAVLLLGMNPRTMDMRDARTFLALFFNLMDDDTRDYFEDRLMDRTDPFELDSEGGIADIFEYLSEEWSGKATKQPSDFQQSQSATGRASTASTRAKASTSSRSRSRASSR